MIKKSVFENDLISGMTAELRKQASQRDVKDLVKAADYLHSAVEIFEETGMKKCANSIMEILSKIAHEPKKTDAQKFHSLAKKHNHDLSVDQMIANLTNHGTMLADDSDSDSDPYSEWADEAPTTKTHKIPLNEFDANLEGDFEIDEQQAYDLLNIDDSNSDDLSVEEDDIHDFEEEQD